MIASVCLSGEASGFAPAVVTPAVGSRLWISQLKLGSSVMSGSMSSGAEMNTAQLIQQVTKRSDTKTRFTPQSMSLLLFNYYSGKLDNFMLQS